VHVGKELAGSSQTGLNLVHHQQDIFLAADVRRLPEKSFRWDDDSSLALDGLYQKSASVGGDGVAEGMSISEWNDFEPWREWAKAIAILFAGGKAYDSDGAAMEIVGAHNDLGFVLGPGVSQKPV